MLGYDFEVQYRPGPKNRVADGLSRVLPAVQLQHLVAPAILDMGIVSREVGQDVKLMGIIQRLQQDPDSVPKFEWIQGKLLYKKRLVLSKTSSLIPSVLHTFNDLVLGGHSGFLRTYKRLTGELYWEGMKGDVKKYVTECLICQQNKTLGASPAGLLQPLEVPDRILEEITMDFVEGLPKSWGLDTILVIVDRLSKAAHFICLKHPFTAKDVAEMFVKEVVRLHGFPKSIVLDRDKIFLSNFWSELFRLQGTKLCRSTTYHPQSDGQSEVVNKSVELYLRCFCCEQPKKWSHWISWAEYWYNTTYNSAIGMNLFQAVYGREPPPLLTYGDMKTSNANLDQ